MNKNDVKHEINQVWLRILIFFIAGLLIPSIAGTFVEYLIFLIFDINKTNSELAFVFGQSIGIIFVIFLFLTEIEFENWDYVGFIKTPILNIALTFLYSCIFIICPCFFILLSDNISVIEFNFNFSVLNNIILLYFFVAINEEFFFRGYILPTLLKIFSPFISVLLNSTIFSIVHLLNANITFIGIMNIFLFGILINLFFIKTNNIILTITIHWGWNLTQAILGYNVSGSKVKSLFTIENTGKSFMTGGEFGIEGSIVVTICLFTTILFYIYYTNLKVVLYEKE